MEQPANAYKINIRINTDMFDMFSKLPKNSTIPVKPSLFKDPEPIFISTMESSFIFQQRNNVITVGTHDSADPLLLLKKLL